MNQVDLSFFFSVISVQLNKLQLITLFYNCVIESKVILKAVGYELSAN